MNHSTFYTLIPTYVSWYTSFRKSHHFEEQQVIMLVACWLVVSDIGQVLKDWIELLRKGKVTLYCLT